MCVLTCVKKERDKTRKDESVSDNTPMEAQWRNRKKAGEDKRRERERKRGNRKSLAT